MSRLTPTLKQNPAREPPSPRPPHTALTFSHSRSFLFHSFILSLLSSKLSLSFTAYPGREGNNVSTLCSPEYLLETQSGPLIPHILFLSFLSFVFFFHAAFLRGDGGRGNLNRLAVNSSLFSLLFSPRRHFFLLALFLQAQTHTFHQKKGTKEVRVKETPANKRRHN